jgi:hypothetical protein
MSVLDSLLRLVDPIAHRQKQEERRRKRNVQPPGVDAELDSPATRPEQAAAPLVCRVCGYRGGPDHPYCPRCLAQTMERAR